MTKSVVVTGGGSGIGREICLELARREYRVVVADIAQRDAQETVSLIKANGGDSVAIKCDVTKPEEVIALVDASVAKYGPPTMVFSNAGAAVGKPAVDYSRSDLEWLFSLNVFGTWDVCARFAKYSISTGHPVQIVVTGSEHSLGLPHNGMAAYTATKHATLGFTEVMRAEWQQQPPSISILCPGLSQSRLWEGERHREGAKGEPDAMAAAVLAAGMPAEKVAAIAVDGAERGDFYIFTHSHSQSYAQRRYDEIEEGFRVLNTSAPSERSYDLNLVTTELLAGQDSKEGEND